ncbi:MAG: hypothetical protein IVW52_05035 [Acidimicrobiales bacterium]|nr:hypothetical protein [Acidimicrobiales bacterium]
MTPAQRSAHMAKIGTGLRKNGIERRVHEILKGGHVRHRMYPGVRPSADVEVPTIRGPLYVAVDGCFWHACDIHYRRPESRVGFWKAHIEDAEKRRARLRARAPFPWVRIMEHWVRNELNARDMVLGMVYAAVEKVERRRVESGEVEVFWDDVTAVWASHRPPWGAR